MAEVCVPGRGALTVRNGTAGFLLSPELAWGGGFGSEDLGSFWNPGLWWKCDHLRQALAF